KIRPDGKVKVLDFGLAKAMENAPPNEALSNSPTMLSGTMGGMILGTAAYMSPEHAKGRAAVLKSEPDFNLIPVGLNARLNELLRRCLNKNAKHRWHCAGDLQMEIEAMLSRPREEPVDARTSRYVPWAVAALAVIGAITAGWVLWPTPANRATIRL